MSGRVVWDIHAPAEGVNKQLNFTVKKKPQTTYYVYVLYI